MITFLKSFNYVIDHELKYKVNADEVVETFETLRLVEKRMEHRKTTYFVYFCCILM